MIDTHAHLTDDRLLPDADAVVARAREAGVHTIVTIGTKPETSRAAISLAERLPGVFATAGIHPHEAEHATAEALSEIHALLSHPRVVAVGETGLDFHYDHSPREAQRRSFLRHLEMAREADLPLVVHSRSADDDLRAILADARGTRGVLHCFAGDAPLLERALEVGWHVSFSGMITFRRYEGADLVRSVPAERLLVETDSPYLAPVPYRGRTNEPAYVIEIVRRAAEIRDQDPEELSAQVVRNARELYRLDRFE